VEKHIVSLSGGKDSTALLLQMLEKNYPIDEVIFIDTGMEFKSMYKHLQLLEKSIGIPITPLTFDKPFLYYMFDHVKRNGNKGYKWCGRMCRWGTTLKQQIFSRYIKEKYHNNIVEYQGIAADEPERLLKNANKKWEVKYPLAEWGMSEYEALKYCYHKGYHWDNLYNHFDRVSCWCCWNKNLKELKAMYYYYSEIWHDLKELECKVGIPFKDNTSLDQLEKRFKQEGIQMKIFN